MKGEGDFFENCVFGVLKREKGEKGRIFVDLQKGKFEEFLKLKKPVEEFELYRNTMGFMTGDGGNGNGKDKAGRHSGLQNLNNRSSLEDTTNNGDGHDFEDIIKLESK